MGNKKFVLVIDGGGSWGALPAKFCAKLENSLGNGIRLKDKIDLFVGTSTGALICSALNIGRGGETLGLRADKIFSKYTDLIKTVFTENDNLSLPEQIFRIFTDVSLDPRYTSEGIRTAFEDVFSNNVVNTFGKYDLRRTLDNRYKPLAIVSYHLNAENKQNADNQLQPVNPLKVFKSWQAEDKDTKVIDALIASSSVPTVHRPQEFDNKFFIDGGLLAEDPILIAVQCVYEMLENKLLGSERDGGERKPIFEAGDEVHFISVGTGFEERKFDTTDLDVAGELFWAKRIAKVFLAGQHSINSMMYKVLEYMADNSKLSLNFHRFNYNIQSHLNNEELISDDEKRFKKGAEKNWKLLEAAANSWYTELEGNIKFNKLVGLMSEN